MGSLDNIGNEKPLSPNKQIIERQKKEKQKLPISNGLEDLITPTEEPEEVFEIEVEEAPAIPTSQEIVKRQIALDPNQEIPEEVDFALALKDVPQNGNALVLPTKEDIDYKVKLVEYIKQAVITPEDIGEMYGNPMLKASGYDKFISHFKLNVSYPSIDTYEDDDGWHCDVTCRVESRYGKNGEFTQVIEAYGGASMNTMTIRKTRANMKSLAQTRAKTRAVRVIMGFSKPSYEEMLGSGDDTDALF